MTDPPIGIVTGNRGRAGRPHRRRRAPGVGGDGGQRGGHVGSGIEMVNAPANQCPIIFTAGRSCSKFHRNAPTVTGTRSLEHLCGVPTNSDAAPTPGRDRSSRPRRRELPTTGCARGLAPHHSLWPARARAGRGTGRADCGSGQYERDQSRSPYSLPLTSPSMLPLPPRADALLSAVSQSRGGEFVCGVPPFERDEVACAADCGSPTDSVMFGWPEIRLLPTEVDR